MRRPLHVPRRDVTSQDMGGASVAGWSLLPLRAALIGDDDVDESSSMEDIDTSAPYRRRLLLTRRRRYCEDCLEGGGVYIRPWWSWWSGVSTRKDRVYCESPVVRMNLTFSTVSFLKLPKYYVGFAKYLLKIDVITFVSYEPLQLNMWHCQKSILTDFDQNFFTGSHTYPYALRAIFLFNHE